MLLAFVLGEDFQQAGKQAEIDSGNVVGVIKARLSATLRRLPADREHLAVSLPLEALAPGVRRPGRTLLADIRTEDKACRYGGEVFLIVLSNMPLAAARVRAEAGRRVVAALSIGHGNRVIGFSIPLGLAAYPEDGKAPDGLIRRADRALCRAKAAGRNRVLAEAG